MRGVPEVTEEAVTDLTNFLKPEIQSRIYPHGKGLEISG
jgi:hypothetical protein